MASKMGSQVGLTHPIFLVLVISTCLSLTVYTPPVSSSRRSIVASYKWRPVVYSAGIGIPKNDTDTSTYRILSPQTFKITETLSSRRSAGRRQRGYPLKSTRSMELKETDPIPLVPSSNPHYYLPQSFSFSRRVRREDPEATEFPDIIPATPTTPTTPAATPTTPPTTEVNLSTEGTSTPKPEEGDDEKSPTEPAIRGKSKGSNAIAISESGKAQAVAASTNGNATAEAINGTETESVALTTHETGDAQSSASTFGAKGAKAIAVAKKRGKAISNSISKGVGRSIATAISLGGNNAFGKSEAAGGGNSSALTMTTGEGSSHSISCAKNGSSAAAAASNGTGNATADSTSGGLDSVSNATAFSQGGDVIANSKNEGTGESNAVGGTIGKGAAFSNALSQSGSSNARTTADQGDSIAKAVEGTVEEREISELSKSAENILDTMNKESTKT